MTKAFIPYIAELRVRVIYCLAFFFCVFLPIFTFRKFFYSLLVLPMVKFLPESNLISTAVLSSFWVPVKIAAFLSLLVAMPFILWQLWSFVRPALYSAERNIAFFIVSCGYLLFLLGILFAYFVVFPIMFAFIHHEAPYGVTLMTDIDQYWSFICSCFLSFGFCFELPVVMLVVSYWGIFDESKYIHYRRHAIVSSFVIAAILSPPDVLSQCLLAIPLCFLYELGILLVRLVLRSRNNGEYGI